MDSSAYEIIKKYERREITRDEMISILQSWEFPLFVPNGSFESTVGRALDEELITVGDYDAIVEALDRRERADAPHGEP